MDVLLVMFKSDGARRDFQITKDRVIVGRKTDCDLRIPLSSVSRHHCELTIDREQQQVALRDLGSSNGTYHNNVRVQEAVLAAGDEVMVGPVVFTVVIDGQPEEIEPVRTVLNENGSEAAVVSTGSEAVPGGVSTADDSGQTLPAIEDDPEEDHTPTVDINDPIEALQRMADSEADADDSAGYYPTGEEDDEPSERQA
ncbi:MAG: FHA domain-containing protein [Phycisphaeraceae bacterium]